jgi:hypothetical protein
MKIKITPKDVAWFDTTYVMAPSDTLKQLLDLKNINVYRRKHRLQFNITTQAHVQNNPKNENLIDLRS